MTNPLEETWFAGDGVLHTGNVRVAVFEPVGGAEITAVQKARAHLAAQAPAMARLLLDLAGDDDRYDVTTSYVDDGDRKLIDVVLRAAGVLPKPNVTITKSDGESGNYGFSRACAECKRRTVLGSGTPNRTGPSGL